MNANDDLERRIADFYATEAPPGRPTGCSAQALATIDTTPQRRVLIRVPWRFPTDEHFRQAGGRDRGRHIRRPCRAGRPAARHRVQRGRSRDPKSSPSQSPERITEPVFIASSSAYGNVHVGHARDLGLVSGRLDARNGDRALDLRHPGASPRPSTSSTTIEPDPTFIASPHSRSRGKSPDVGQGLWNYPLGGQCGPLRRGRSRSTALRASSRTAGRASHGLVSPPRPRLPDLRCIGVDDPAWFDEILATVQLHPEDALDAAPSDLTVRELSLAEPPPQLASRPARAGAARLRGEPGGAFAWLCLRASR